MKDEEMGDEGRQENIAELNDRSFSTLLRSIERLQGEFALILVRCNYASLRDRTVDRLQQQNPNIQTLTLPETTKSLYTEIRRHLSHSPTPLLPHSLTPPSALFILGLETLTALDPVLVSTNSIRDEFRNQFPFPLVLWVNDWGLQKLTRLAPDFKSWSGGAVIDFELAIADLIDSLRDHTNRLFASILDTGDERFPPNWVLTPPANSLRRSGL